MMLMSLMRMNTAKCHTRIRLRLTKKLKEEDEAKRIQGNLILIKMNRTHLITTIKTSIRKTTRADTNQRLIILTQMKIYLRKDTRSLMT